MCLYWLGVEEKWVGPHLHALHMHMCAIYRERLQIHVYVQIVQNNVLATSVAALTNSALFL